MLPSTPFIPRVEFKRLRLEQDLTTGEVACSTHISRTSIERFEAGTRDINSESFLKLVHFYRYKIVPEKNSSENPKESLKPKRNKPEHESV